VGDAVTGRRGIFIFQAGMLENEAAAGSIPTIPLNLPLKKKT
jgi:hypothetical protein